MYTRLVTSVLFPFHERLKGHESVRRLRELERTQWHSAPAIADLRDRRLQRFLDHAARRVPYYRELFAQLGVHARDIRRVSDLGQLPLLDKAAIREAGDRLVAEGARNLMSFSTGGSSGEPLTFLLGRERISHDVAAKWRATRWWGVDIGDPEAVVWGSPIELGGQGRIKALRDRLLRTRLYPAFSMSGTDMTRFLAGIRRQRPRMLFGYPSALALLAGHARATGEPMDDLGIRVAFVTGERLYPEQAERIREVFGCVVANGYGGRDAGFIAHECPQGGMHISAEDVLVEVVDAEGRTLPAGEAGEVVVTHLATGAFPFIRYRTGDIAVLDDRVCPCGRGLPLLRSVEGRDTDFIVAPDGTRMHGLALIYVLRELPGVERFKIIQESTRQVRVLVVPGRQWSPETEDGIRRGIRRRMGSTVGVEVERVEGIPAERSGKYRYVVSHVRVAA